MLDESSMSGGQAVGNNSRMEVDDESSQQEVLGTSPPPGSSSSQQQVLGISGNAVKVMAESIGLQVDNKKSLLKEVINSFQLELI